MPADGSGAQDGARLYGPPRGAGPRRDLLPRAPGHAEGGRQGDGDALLAAVLGVRRRGRRVEGGDAEDGKRALLCQYMCMCSCVYVLFCYARYSPLGRWYVGMFAPPPPRYSSNNTPRIGGPVSVKPGKLGLYTSCARACRSFILFFVFVSLFFMAACLSAIATAVLSGDE